MDKNIKTLKDLQENKVLLSREKFVEYLKTSFIKINEPQYVFDYWEIKCTDNGDKTYIIKYEKLVCYNSQIRYRIIGIISNVDKQTYTLGVEK